MPDTGPLIVTTNADMSRFADGLSETMNRLIALNVAANERQQRIELHNYLYMLGLIDDPDALADMERARRREGDT